MGQRVDNGTGEREHPRLARERTTIGAMIRIACEDWHGTAERLCHECHELQEYADARLDKCPYQEGKPTCSKCPIHCYMPEMRERIQEVMRYAGPRMYRRHPILTIFHVLDGLKKPPELPKKKQRQT